MDKKSLRAWRKRMGLTQAEAARLFGVNWSTFQRWESGANQPTSWVMVALACAALHHRLVPYEDATP